MAITRSNRSLVNGSKETEEVENEVSDQSKISAEQNQKTKGQKKMLRKTKEGECSKIKVKPNLNSKSDLKSISTEKTTKNKTFMASEIKDIHTESDVPRYTEGEFKGKKIPAYKVEQLRRLQRLIDLSSAAKPRGPIISTHVNKQKKDLNGSLKIKLDEHNKEKVSNVTNYDPIRKKYVTGELGEKEKTELFEKYSKIRKYKNIKVPDISNDLYLKEVLSELVEQNQALRGWDAFSTQLGSREYCNDTLYENEKKLNLFEVHNTQRHNLLEQQLKHSISEVKTEPCGDLGGNSNGNASVLTNNLKSFHKIDIKKVMSETELDAMLENIEGVPQDNVVDENEAFEGLELDDFTKLKTFGNGKI